MSVNINKIENEGIQSIQSKLVFPLNGKTIVIYGENGTEKNSISDSAEWFYTNIVYHLSSYEFDLKYALRNINKTEDDTSFVSLSYVKSPSLDGETGLVFSTYTVFRVKDTTFLLPEYLYIYFKRIEFDRYAIFNSWESARETFEWVAMCNVKLPIPYIKLQEAIVTIYNILVTRKRINELLRISLNHFVLCCCEVWWRMWVLKKK